MRARQPLRNGGRLHACPDCHPMTVARDRPHRHPFAACSYSSLPTLPSAVGAETVGRGRVRCPLAQVSTGDSGAHHVPLLLLASIPLARNLDRTCAAIDATQMRLSQSAAEMRTGQGF